MKRGVSVASEGKVAGRSLPHAVRIVTAASLFDGHDAAINIMRRIIQASGVEVIHIGHNHSVEEIVQCAIQEDVQAVAITSYQGGHLEFFKYMYDLLKERGAGHIKIFGGGGGTILPQEIEELHRYGIAHIYSPDDGREMGLQGMIDHMVAQCDGPTGQRLPGEPKRLSEQNHGLLAGYISCAENNVEVFASARPHIQALAEKQEGRSVVMGITGTGGAGKSSLTDEIVQRYLRDFPKNSVGIVSVDPSRQRTGGALLGDRIRMNSIYADRVYMRSLATRQANTALSQHVQDVLDILKAARFDLIILESSGVGQADTEITNYVDFLLYVMTSEYGAATQLEKINMLDYADLIAINKFDKKGSLDALRDVRKQYKRNHKLFDLADEATPVYATMASQFNDSGLNALYEHVKFFCHKKDTRTNGQAYKVAVSLPDRDSIVPPERVRYLSEIAETVRSYNQQARGQQRLAQDAYALWRAMDLLGEEGTEKKALRALFEKKKKALTKEHWQMIQGWEKKKRSYRQEEYKYKVRGREIKVRTHTSSLSQTDIPKIVLPSYEAWGDVLYWQLQENVPGEFPYTSGVFPFKRQQEDPIRMFAGEGGPERTNRRFHYLSKDSAFVRLSTAFDSVTLYGEDPHHRPDIYGKIGNAGVSICTLQDAKKLYSGFDLCHVNASVSMTINGPASILCAFFMNAAIDQQCEKYIQQEGLVEKVEERLSKLYGQQLPPQYRGKLPKQHNGLGLQLLGLSGDEVLPKDIYARIKADTLKAVRGTVQADISRKTRHKTHVFLVLSSRCGSWVTCSLISLKTRFRTFIRCPFRAITSPRPVQTPSRSWHSPWQMGSPTWNTTWREAWMSMILRPISAFSFLMVWIPSTRS